MLTFAESEQRLNELLRVKVSDAGKSPKQAQLSELEQRKPSVAEKTALNELSQNLVLFTIRANPVMRPIVREYQQIAALLARGKRKRIIKRLARLEMTHTKLVARMSDVDDYMNWFEATQSNRGSGVFADYLKTAGDAQIPAPRRRDALSVYLDSLAEQLEDYAYAQPYRDSAAQSRRDEALFLCLFGWSFVDYRPDYASFDDGRMAGGELPSGPINNECRSCSAVACAVVADYHMPRD